MIILVTGFQRSGTTLVRQLIQGHPDVVKILHEHNILENRSGKEAIYRYLKVLEDIRNPETCTWGDKVPFFTSNFISTINYMRKWQALWGTQSRIVCLIRHPIDVAISNMKFKTKFNYKIERLMEYQTLVVPKVVEVIKFDQENILAVSYESLVTRPYMILQKIYKFCNLDYSNKIVDKVIIDGLRSAKKSFIDSTRAYAYKWDNPDNLSLLDSLSYDYEKLRKLEYVL